MLFERKKKDANVVLATMHSFIMHGVDEVSLPLLLETVMELQKSLLLRYHFYKDCFYSADLFFDLDQLGDHGYLQRYEYIQDAFLPKTFYKLTSLGTGEAKKILDSLMDEDTQAIANAVSVSISNDKKMWQPYERSLLKRP